MVGAFMKIRAILLCIVIAFSGIVQTNLAQQAQLSSYQQEFFKLKESAELAHLFQKDVYIGAHAIEKQIQNYSAIPDRLHRLACCLFLSMDVMVVTKDNMPELHSFIEKLAQKANIKTPYVFITISKGAVNAFAFKILKGIGGILIDQKALCTFTNEQLESVIAHEMGHIKFDHVNKTLALMIPAFFASLYVSHKAMNGLKLYLPENKVCNWGYWAASYLRYIGLHEYSLGLVSAVIMTYITKSLVIGKKFESQADNFAHEMGYAQGLKQAMEILEQQYEKSDAQLMAANDKIMAAKEKLTTKDFVELQNAVIGQKIIIKFLRWTQANTPFEPHPSNADRIAAAQAYLDAQVQAPVIEKA